MTRKHDWPLIMAIGGLLFALLVCIVLLSVQATRNPSAQLQVMQQEYRIELQSIRRDYELKINRLQEQVNSVEFVTKKRADLTDDDVRKNKREIDDLRERLKAPSN